MHLSVARALDEDLDNVSDDDVRDTISIESGMEIGSLPLPPIGAVSAGASSHGGSSWPWLQRLRQRLAWGAVTREEKRALRGGASSISPDESSIGSSSVNGVGRAARTRRRVQRQSTISVPTDLLIAALRSTLAVAGDEADSADIAELSALLRLQLRHELQEASLWLVDAFDILAGGDGGVGTTPALSHGEFSTHASDRAAREDLDTLSDRFIDGLCSLMQRANYRLLSQRELQFAQLEDFMFTVPVDVAWEDLDSSMISRLFVRHPHLGLHAALLARRVLVFHRGAGVATTTSFFWEEKLDRVR